MSFFSIGVAFGSADEVSEKLNDARIGEAAMVASSGYNQGMPEWTLWGEVSERSRANRSWSLIATDASGEKIAEAMTENKLAPSCAIVATGIDGKWHLWGLK